MKLIPALDLKRSRIVHATGGDRKSYEPLANVFFPSSSPVDVIQKLHGRFHCETFYIADLDAISGNKDTTPAIRELIQAFPTFTWWIDAGIKNHSDFTRLSENHNAVMPIVATETLTDTRLPGKLHADRKEFILSLDFRNDGLLGDPAILESAEHWPETVILLSLACVGANAGPDTNRILAFREKYPQQRFIVGGGIRNERDLTWLESHGITEVLVANALYTGTIAARPEKSSNYRQTRDKVLPDKQTTQT